MSQNIADQMKRAMGKDQFSMKKLVAIVIFAAIAVVFIFTGYNSHTQLGAGNAAQVNNSLISLADLDRERRRIEQQYSQMFGGMDFGAGQRQALMQAAIQDLVGSELVSQATRKEGLGATDGEVLDFIVKDYTVFQVNGVFQRDRYFQFLEMNRFSPTDFEGLIRKEIENLRSRRAFEWTSGDNKLEKEKAQKLKQAQITLSYVEFNPRDLEGTMKFTQAEVNAALAKPEFAKRAEDEFKARKSQFDQKEQVKAQHILVRFQNGDTKSENAALEKAKKLREQAVKGDFGTVAAANSEDPGSKAKKGDLGFFSRGQMVPEFEETAFSQKVGDVSQPIKTQFGYHIIKTNEKKAAVEATFENFKANAAEILLARDLINTEKSKMEEAFAKGEEAAWMKTMKLSWKDTAGFDLAADSIPGIQSEKVVASLSDVLANGQKSHIVRDGDKYYAVKLKEVKNVMSTDNAMANAQDAMQKMKAQDLFESWIQKFRETSKVEINPQVLQ